MIDLKTVFPKASRSFIEANSATPEPSGKENALQTAPNAKKAPSMTRPEREMAMILEAMKRKSEIRRYLFEGMTLRWQCGSKPDGTPIYIKYTPDFVVFRGSALREGWTRTGIKLIEVKGPFCKGNRERAVERYRHAKTYWPEFAFELHQLTKDGWIRLL